MAHIGTLVLLAFIPCAVGQSFPCAASIQAPGFRAEAVALGMDLAASSCFAGVPVKARSHVLASGACPQDFDAVEGGVCKDPTCKEALVGTTNAAFDKCNSNGKFPLFTAAQKCQYDHLCDRFPSSKSMASLGLLNMTSMILAGLAGGVVGAMVSLVALRRYSHEAQDAYVNIGA